MVPQSHVGVQIWQYWQCTNSKSYSFFTIYLEFCKFAISAIVLCPIIWARCCNWRRVVVFTTSSTITYFIICPSWARSLISTWARWWCRRRIDLFTTSSTINCFIICPAWTRSLISSWARWRRIDLSTTSSTVLYFIIWPTSSCTRGPLISSWARWSTSCCWWSWIYSQCFTKVRSFLGQRKNYIKSTLCFHNQNQSVYFIQTLIFFYIVFNWTKNECTIHLLSK